MLSTFALKIIAVISMLIDHIGAVFFPQAILLRIIGRLAFPIYCFLIAEGYTHTKSAPGYLMRLGAFALISEIPFNFAFNGRIFYFGGCNVFITLFLGLLGIILFDMILKWDSIPRLASFVLALVPVALLCRTADTLHSDYGKYGVLLVFIFYLFRQNRTAALFMFALSTVLKYAVTANVYDGALKLFEANGTVWYLYFGMTQMFCLLAAIPIALYSGQSGYKGLKWFFYAFYPVHLLLLGLLALCF